MTETYSLVTRKLSPEKYRQISTFTAWRETRFKTKYSEPEKIKNFNIILLKLVFSNKITNGY